MIQYITGIKLTSNQQVGGLSPPGIAIVSLEKLSLSLDHSFYRLLSINMILSAEMALCHSKSDPRVTRNTGIFRFLLDGVTGCV